MVRETLLGLSAQRHQITLARAALKRTNLRGQTPSCGFLQVLVVFCEDLRFSAKICVSQMLCFLAKRENLQKSAKFCENLRLGLGLSL